MCLQVLCNLRPPPPRCCTLNRRRWQSSLFPLGPRHLPTPRRTHAHTPSPHPQDEAASSSCRSRVGSESRRPSDGPALRLLGSRRNAHPSPDCSARPRRSANCKSLEGELRLRRPGRSVSTRPRLPRAGAPSPTRSIRPAAQFVLVVCAKVKEPVKPSSSKNHQMNGIRVKEITDP